MPQSNLPSTSHEANERMTTELRQKDYDLILGALRVLKIAIYEEIAEYLGWSDKNKVSRRQKEMVGLGLIYNLGTKKLTKSGRNAYQYAILTPDTVIVEIQKEHYAQSQTTAADYANKLIAATKQGKLIQNQLFND
jgi:predicted transcriptional regulator